MYKTEKCCQVTTGLQILPSGCERHMYQWTGAFKKLMKHKVLAGSFYLFSPPGLKEGNWQKLENLPTQLQNERYFLEKGNFSSFALRISILNYLGSFPPSSDIFPLGIKVQRGAHLTQWCYFPPTFGSYTRSSEGRGWKRWAPRLGIGPQVVSFLHISAAEGLPISVCPPAAGGSVVPAPSFTVCWLCQLGEWCFLSHSCARQPLWRAED